MILKRVALIIMMTLFMQTVVPQSFTIAGEQNEVLLIDYAQAGVMAVENSKDLKNNMIDKTRLGRQITNLKNSVNSISSTYSNVNDVADRTNPLIDSIITLNNNVDSMAYSEELQVEGLKNVVKSTYVALYKIEVQKKSVLNQIDLLERTSGYNRTKYKNGLLSKYDLDVQLNQLSVLKRQYQAISTGYIKTENSLKELIGVETSRRIKFDYSFIEQYKPLQIDFDLSNDEIIKDNLAIKALARSLKNSNNQYEDAKSRYPKGDNVTEDTVYSLEKAKLEYNETLKNSPYKYRAAVLSLNDMIEDYNSKLKTLIIKEKDYQHMILKNKLGLASDFELYSSLSNLNSFKFEIELSRLACLEQYNSRISILKGLN